MKIIYALALFALLDFALLGANDMIAHTAHLSGLVVGIIMGVRIKRSQAKYHSYAQYEQFRR
jgi:membrane associated rhomboid family serine protease